MKIVEYVTPLGFDGRRRTRHARIGSKVVGFLIQYEVKFKNKWYPVVRYDTAHGYAHKDTLSYKGAVKKDQLPFNDYNVALTFAEKDLRENWLKYRESFFQEAKDK